MARITLQHTKKLSELERKSAMRSLKRHDPQESLRERVRQRQRFEKKFGMSSVVLYQKYRTGEMGDSAEVMRWSATYESYLSLIQTSFLPQATAT